MIGNRRFGQAKPATTSRYGGAPARILPGHGEIAAGNASIDSPLLLVAMALLSVMVPILAHKVAPALGLALCFAAAVLLASQSLRAVCIALLCAFLFQNMAIAVVTPDFIDVEEFNLLRAYNFVITAACVLLTFFSAVLRWRSLRPGIQFYLAAVVLVLAVIGFYFLFGLAAHGKNAAIYLRNVGIGAMLFFICINATRDDLASFMGCAKIAGVLLLIYGYLELIFGFGFLDLFNGRTYLMMSKRDFFDSGYFVKQMKDTGFVFRSADDFFKVTPFNITYLRDLGISVFRLNGPNMHPISFAYALTFFALIAAAERRLLYMVLAIPLLVVVGSKGAMITLLLVVGAVAIAGIYPSRTLFWSYCIVLGVYISLAFVYGLKVGDYHVLGFLGGVNGFIGNPIGHGLGAGGNLSVDSSQIDWNRAQALGSAGVAVESAWGVLLYQMGIGAIALIGFYLWIANRAWKLFLVTGQLPLAAAALGVLTITVNGIFQEEALFSPLAIGVMMIFAGLAIGAAVNEGGG